MGRRDLTDEQWQRLHLLATTPKPRTGRTASRPPPARQRHLVDSRTGAPARFTQVAVVARVGGSALTAKVCGNGQNTTAGEQQVRID